MPTPLKFNEETKVISIRVPKSMAAIYKKKLKNYMMRHYERHVLGIRPHGYKYVKKKDRQQNEQNQQED